MLRREAYSLCDLPMVDVYLAREKARRGDRDDAIPLMRSAVDDLAREGQLLAWAFRQPVFWCRHCWTEGLKVTWPKPRPQLSG